jgi:hypothetical protein
MILSTQYTSFSLFGLYFIFITGAIIIAASYGMERIFDFFQRYVGSKEDKSLQWQANQMLYLQSLCFHSIGRGIWSKGTVPVPVTRPGDKLHPLPYSYDFDKAPGQGETWTTDKGSTFAYSKDSTAEKANYCLLSPMHGSYDAVRRCQCNAGLSIDRPGTAPM